MSTEVESPYKSAQHSYALHDIQFMRVRKDTNRHTAHREVRNASVTNTRIYSAPNAEKSTSRD